MNTRLDMAALPPAFRATAGLVSSVSLADELEFAALPHDVQQLARRVLGAPASAWDVDVRMIAKAYKAGFEAAVEEMCEPWCSDTEAQEAALELVKEGLRA